MDEIKTVLLDARNLLCPMPVIRTQQAIESLKNGVRITVTSTDPGAINDIPAWARVHGHRVLQIEELDGEYLVTLEIAGKP